MAGDFTDLTVYKKAKAFRKRIWLLVHKLPKNQEFVLVSQMRRASLSVTNNIAEGHGCGTYTHNISYLRRSRGSMNELVDDISVCEDESFFKKDHLDVLMNDASEVLRLINGYIRFLKKRKRLGKTDSD